MTSATRAARVVEPLADYMRDQLEALVDADPIVNAVLAARLSTARSLAPNTFGGVLIGVREGSRLVAAAFNGGNLLPVGGDERSWSALADYCGQRARLCTSIVGRADVVDVFWRGVQDSWGPARDVRPDQPLLVTDRRPPAEVGRHPELRQARPDEFERYLRAAAAMFTEELGIFPLTGTSASAYRRRVEGLLHDRRAFTVTDADGEVLFKADVGALTRRTCQLQGVWVRPDLRGQGIGAAALAAVVDRALELAPTVSLYVNRFNAPARRLYDRLGMRQISTLGTVLF